MKTIQKALLALSVTVLLFSCSSPDDRGNLIPKRVIAVSAINTKKIVDEIKWDVLFGSDLLKFKSLEKNDLMKKVVEHPMETGIDFSEKAYVYVDSATSLDNIVVASLVPLADGEEFTEFVKANVTGDNQSKTIGELQVKKIDDKLFMAWNENTLFTIVNKTSEKEVADYIEALYAGKETALLTTEFPGKDALTGDAHLSFYVNYSTILSSMKEQVAKAGLKINLDSKMSYAGVVNFKNGLLDVVVDSYTDGKLMDMTKFITNPNLQSVSSSIDASNALAYGGMSFSWKALPDMITKMGGKPMMDGMFMNMGLSMDSLCNSLGDNIAFSFEGMGSKTVSEMVEVYGVDYSTPPTWEMQTRTETYPLLKSTMLLNDTAYIKGIVRKFLGKSAVAGLADVYTVDGGYVFFKDKAIMYSSDSLGYVAMMSGSPKFDNAILKDKSVAMYANFSDMQKKMGKEANSKETGDKAMGLFQKYFSNVAIESLKPTVEHSQITFQIKMVNKEENFVISLLKYAKEMEALVMPAVPGA